jgi:3' terminal RNA ribose 2'-O-methyltransferase Hen1
MLLTLTTTHQPATDLGYLLHKHPGRVHSADVRFGTAYVFYPEASEERCTMALLLDIDPIALVRGKGGARERTLDQYVNDRPYVASSFLSVALRDMFSTAMGGKSRERPELTTTPLPFSLRIAALPVRGGDGAGLLQRLFEPLGYTVASARAPLDAQHPEWGDSPYYTLDLAGTVCLRDLLTHVYVLLPVLDNEKHYWVGEDEVEKLVRKGEGWLNNHPERDLITARYLRYQKHLTRDALAQLVADEQPDPDAEELAHDQEEALAEKTVVDQEALVEKTLSLHAQRLEAVLATLLASGARRVLDLGCGEGQLLQRLVKEKQFDQIIGMDVVYSVLERASEKLRLDRMSERQRERIKLIQGSLMYRDERLAGFDAAAVVEVIEHLDPPRLAAFERVVFEFARPLTVAITTPNREYNRLFPSLPAGTFRHRDHRFEWTRAEFEAWATPLAARYGYSVEFAPLGPVDAAAGAPSQMGVFRRDPA